MFFGKLFALLGAAALVMPVLAQTSDDCNAQKLNVTLRQDDVMKRWRHHRLGQFIHFGLYAIPAGTWHGRTVNYSSEWLPSNPYINISSEDWRGELMPQFSLDNFNATEWAECAKNSGAGYVAITTKHHEGFSLWPTNYTQNHIGNTPFQRDLLGELVEAYDKAGLDVMLYYSILDWANNDWRPQINNEDDRQAYARWKVTFKNQLFELMDRYPTMIGFWFDGAWDPSIVSDYNFTAEVEHELKQKKPDILINSRLRDDPLGTRHTDEYNRPYGDFGSDFERVLPSGGDVITRDWEACQTIPEHSWGYFSGPWGTHSVKDWRYLVDQVAHTTSQNGNFLLNVGPRGDGSQNPSDVEITGGLGKWINSHSKAIRGAGEERRLTAPDWGYYTLGEDGRTYGIVTKISPSGRVRVESGDHLQITDIHIDDDVDVAEPYLFAPNLLEVRLGDIPDHPFTIAFTLTNYTVIL